MSRFALNRRTLLRGIAGGAAAVALPVLEAMLNGHGEALADGTQLPKRFGLWYFGNGVVQDQWNPAATGSNWALTPALQPLAGVQDYASIVTETWIPANCPTAHWSQWGSLRSASEDGSGPRADDVIADYLSQGVPHRSVDLRITRVPNGGYVTDDAGGIGLGGFRADPHQVYADLFTGFVPPGGQVDTKLRDAKKSVLDAVLADAKDLRKRLGTADQARLDAHMDSISSIEKQLFAMAPDSCVLPQDPGGRPADGPGLQEPLEEVNRMMSDLLVYALACDLARNFRIYFTSVQSETVFWQCNTSQGHHELGHAMPHGDTIKDIVVFTMKQLAYLLEKMRDTAAGNGNLLDQSCIWVTSEITAPDVHDTWSIPTLVVGKAGGTLKGGIHYSGHGNPDGNYKSQIPDAIHARVLVTMMNALGMSVDGFGSGKARGVSTIPELMV